MICPACGTENEDNRKFCGECGNSLAMPCPSCGTANAPGMKFCGECGANLRGPTANADAAPSPTAERRLVSVMFADLVGSTTLAESRDPEAVRELQSQYFEACRVVVESYGGTVEKFIGDAVMAVWGTPVAHEDDAERAVRTALDLVEAVRALGESLDVNLQVRAGVLTGEAAVTLGATNQGMVAGDLVNTAARLQSVAPPGTVLVGTATYEAASEAIAFEPAGDQVLKGKNAPVQAFRAMRVIARRGGAGRSEQLEAPFVGRAPELRMLKDFHAATAAERRPRLVSIIGQGGIGKTRLVWEFQKYMDGVTEVVYWHQGRSPAYGEGISFWALAEMVRGRAGIAELDDPDAARAKLISALEQYIPDEAERRWMEPRLQQLLGLETADTADREPERQSLFAAWRLFFERIAENGVVVLVFEDLQWADDGLLDFIDDILEWSRDRPIYLISLARPELLDRRKDWGAGRRNFTSLVLEPLTSDEMRQLLEGLVPGLPLPVVERILSRAEGIPLYAVETVRMLLGEGLVVPENGVYRPVGDLSELSVPASLHALIASRLDALDPADRALLQAASVLGKTFKLDALTSVSGLTADDVALRVRGLVRHELLTLEADPRSPEQGQYGFVQGLIREVAYGTLARRDRRRLHVSAARYFEALDDEGIAGALAEHYLSAYRAQPEGPEGDALAAQARVALRAAADRARALGSFVQAMHFLEQAVEVTTDSDETRELEAQAGRAGMAAGLIKEPIAHAANALEMAREKGDRATIIGALVLYCQTLWLDARSGDALALLEPAYRDFRDLVETPDYVQLASQLARTYLILGRREDALRLADETLPVAERLELRWETLDLLVTRGVELGNVGRPREAIAILTGGLAMAEAEELVDLEMRARVNLSYVASGEDVALAYRIARDGWEKVRRLGTRGMFFLLTNAASAGIWTGNWEWALAELEEQVATLETDLFAALHLTMLRALYGRDVGGEFSDLMQRIGERSDPQWASMVDEVGAMIALAAGNASLALERAVRSYSLVTAPEGGNLQIASRAAAWLGDEKAVAAAAARHEQQPGQVAAAARRENAAALAALAGRRREAAVGYADAVRLWRELGAPFFAALCALTCVKVLGNGEPESRAAAAEARAFFERVGAASLLQMLTDAEQEPSSAPAAGAARGGSETEPSSSAPALER